MANKLVQSKQIDMKSVNKSLNLDERTEKIITFCFPSITEGYVGNFFKFPYEGMLVDIDGYCTNPSIVDTVFRIEKCSEKDFKQGANYSQSDSGLILSEEIVGNKVTKDTMELGLFVDSWENVTNEIVIPKNQLSVEKSFVTNNVLVNKNDLFRVKFLSCSTDDLKKMAYNVTIQIVIQVKNNL